MVSKAPLGFNLGVGRSVQILEIPDVFTTMGIGYAGTSGLNLPAALPVGRSSQSEDWTFNPIGAFQTTSIMEEATMLLPNAMAPEQEYLEYHGSTIVERIQLVNGANPQRDWLLFDTVEEAADFYYENRTVS